ncbi:putative leader peptide [Streptomyces sp. NBC_01716]|uniref:putative leader peptide n=1 Tax=Streptomyces sp. NBC_01716 TaxID=2975917 RepID=UPI003FCE0293
MPPKSTGSVSTFFQCPHHVGQQPCNNRAFPGRVAAAGARIARILRVAYRCTVHPGVRLVTRIHVDLLRSASALCPRST